VVRGIWDRFRPQTLSIGGGFFWDHPGRNVGEERTPKDDIEALEDNI